MGISHKKKIILFFLPPSSPLPRHISTLSPSTTLSLSPILPFVSLCSSPLSHSPSHSLSSSHILFISLLISVLLSLSLVSNGQALIWANDSQSLCTRQNNKARGCQHGWDQLSSAQDASVGTWLDVCGSCIFLALKRRLAVTIDGGSWRQRA